MKKRFALIMALLTALTPVQAYAAETQTDAFAENMEAAYEEPEMKYRPYARWWLAEGSHTDETLKESIQELYEAGYGGIEFVTLTSETEYLDDATYGWGSPEWIHDSKLILEECQKYGMSVSMTGGTYWATANLTNITPDMQEASQELGYKTVELTGTAGTNTAYQGELPLCELPEDATQQKLVTVVAAKVESWGSTAEEIAAAEAAEEAGEEVPELVKTVIDSNSFSVVKDAVTDNGDGTYSIDFTAEDDADYILYAFYQYGTSEYYTAASTGKSYTINYLDTAGAEAMISYWNENVLTEEVQEIIDQMEECDLYMDSLELCTEGVDSTKQLWSDAMLEEFETRRGYSLEQYLPLLIRETDTSISGMGEYITYVYDNTELEALDLDSLRNDFFQTQTELYKENCLEVLSEWLHTKNMKLRAETSYGKTFEVSQTVSAVDYLETESFEFAAEPDSYRNFTGAAHIYNKRLSSETGASIFTNYLWNNGYYRQIMYTQYASGIQKTVTHGYSSEYGPEESTVWPGYEGMTNLIAERFNKRQPASLDYADLNLHLSRIQKVLEQGVPQVDIAMLRTDYNLNNLLTSVSSSGVENNRLHSNTAYYWQDLELQNAGYTYDYFSPYLLTDDAVDMSDGMINSDGVAYQAVIVMEEELPLASAEALLEGAKNGLPIVFVNNVTEDVNNDQIMKENTTAASTTGSNDGNDDELAAVVEEIKACENVRTVDSTADAYEALQELGVSPRTEYAESNSQILTTMRKAEDATYLYVYNYMYEDEENYTGQISVEGTYKPYILDTWSGSVTEAVDAYQEDGRTVLNVDLAPGDVAVYVLDPTGEPAGETIETTTEEVALTGWSLSVDSYVPGEKTERTETNDETGVTTTEVTYTTNHETIDAGTLETLVPWKDIEAIGETVSGVGTYTTTFTLPDDWAEGQTVTFKADSFSLGTAMIEVNGQKAAVNMDACTADISDLVQAGENTISVRVTSSLCNVMHTQESCFWLAGGEAEEYGMTGETVIEIEK